ncbi:hypothetical protein TcWFU_001001 [Taenia crassiceps]|uniref:Uncharacterized protein n=1 Tax=Taenia crassiceps TaxID=6207 RepID=A0ABR4Q437_9CEST
MNCRTWVTLDEQVVMLWREAKQTIEQTDGMVGEGECIEDLINTTTATATATATVTVTATVATIATTTAIADYTVASLVGGEAR